MLRAPRFVVVLAVVACAANTPARADVITDWNATTFPISGNSSRMLSMVHLAMFDSINAFDRRYQPYLSQPGAPLGASREAAAAAAAYGVLVRQFPAQKPALDAALAASLAPIPDGQGQDDGVALGDTVASAIHDARLNDGMLVPGPPYVPVDEPGHYQLTPPNFAAPVNTGAASQTPFALAFVDSFRPNGPPRLGSRLYAFEVAVVRSIGAVDSTTRTAEQTMIAEWHRIQGHIAANKIARAATSQSTNLLRNARFFALLNVAMADAGVSVFEAKYHYVFWRPVTAIRAADTDDNPFTEPDPNWTPLLVTPPHPEYPSAHSVISAAGGEVLKAFLGGSYSFSTTSDTVPGVTRTFSSVDRWVADASIARIYGGIHFPSAIVEGTFQGRAVGRYVLRHILRRAHDQP